MHAYPFQVASRPVSFLAPLMICLSIILGVVLNRLNFFVLAFHPPYAKKNYIPSLTECMVSIGLVAALMLVYRIAVTYLPILEPRPKKAQR